MPAKPINFDLVREIALALPGVKENTIHGAPSLKLGGMLLTCPAIHKSAAPDTLAVRAEFAQRAKLLVAEPDVYYVTDHYVNYPLVLIRLSRINRTALKHLLHTAWELLTPKPKSRQKKRG